MSNTHLYIDHDLWLRLIGAGVSLPEKPLAPFDGCIKNDYGFIDTPEILYSMLNLILRMKEEMKGCSSSLK